MYRERNNQILRGVGVEASANTNHKTGKPSFFGTYFQLIFMKFSVYAHRMKQGV